MTGMTDITRHGNNKKERMISGVGVREDALVDFGNQEQVYVDDTDDFDSYTKGPGLVSKIMKAGIAVCMFPVFLLKNFPQLFGKLKFLPGMLKKNVPAIKKIPAFCVTVLTYTGIPRVIGKCTGFFATRKEKSKINKENKGKERFVPLSQAVASRGQDQPVDTIEFSQVTHQKQSLPQIAVSKKTTAPSTAHMEVDGEDPFAEPPRWSMKKRLTFTVACSILLCVCYTTGKTLLHSETTNDEVADNTDSVSIDDFNEDVYPLPPAIDLTSFPSSGNSPLPPPMPLPQHKDSSSNGFSSAALSELPVPNALSHEVASMNEAQLPIPPKNDDRISESQFAPDPLPTNQGISSTVSVLPNELVNTEPMFPAIPASLPESLPVVSQNSAHTISSSSSTPILPSSPDVDPLIASIPRDSESEAYHPAAPNSRETAHHLPDEGLSIPESSTTSLFAAASHQVSTPSTTPPMGTNPPRTSGSSNAPGGLFSDVAQNSSQRTINPAITSNTPVASQVQEPYADQPTRHITGNEAPLVIPEATSMAASSPVPSLFQQINSPQEKAMDIVEPVAAVERSPGMMQEELPVSRRSAGNFSDLNFQESVTEEPGLFSQAITTVSTQSPTKTTQYIQSDQHTGQSFQRLNAIPLTSPVEDDNPILSPSQINGTSAQAAPVSEAYSTRIPSNLPDSERVARIRERLRSLKESDQTRDMTSGSGQRFSTPPSYYGETQSYLLQEGDTWWSVAKRELNDVSRWREIRDLNRDRIESIKAFQPGMEILLPSD